MKKIKELYCSPGKRALTGLVLFVIGIVLSALMLPVSIVVAFFGLLLLTSFMGKKKAYFMANCGAVSVVKLAEYSYPPLFFFMWPFFYKPHQVRYLKVRNLSSVSLEPGTEVRPVFVLSRLADVEEITKEEYAVLTEQPVPESVAQERHAQFRRDAARFLDADLLKPMVENEYFSVCQLPDNCYALFTYQQEDGSPLGMLINEQSAKTLAEKPEKGTAIVLNMAKLTSFFVLDNRRFEIMQRMEETEGVVHAADSEIANKRELTHRQIVQQLEGTYVTGAKTGGILWLIFSIGMLGISITGLISFLPLGLCGLVITALMAVHTVKKLRSIKENRARIRDGRFYLTAPKCIEKRIDEDPEGDDYYLDLEDGNSISVSSACYRTSEIGDTVYILWLEEQKHYCSVYLRREYYLDREAELLIRPLAYSKNL